MRFEEHGIVLEAADLRWLRTCPDCGVSPVTLVYVVGGPNPYPTCKSCGSTLDTGDMLWKSRQYMMRMWGAFAEEIAKRDGRVEEIPYKPPTWRQRLREWIGL